MRQFIAGSEPYKDGSIAVSSKEEKYLIRVLRLQEGSSIDVCHKDGHISSMSLVKKNNLWTLVPNVHEQHSIETGVKVTEMSSSKINLILLQFLPKIQKMDQIVRQATECGVQEIFPINGDFSNGNDYTERTDRWERIIREARQQSGSPVATRIHQSAKIESALEKVTVVRDVHTYYVVLTEISAHTESVFSIFGSFVEPARIVLAVGCEGGISAREMDILDKAGFKHLHFNTNILRAETAALYGIAVIQNAVLEKKTWREHE